MTFYRNRVFVNSDAYVPVQTVATNVFIIGWYSRGNLGDECYKSAWAQILGDMKYRIECVDDIDCIPPDTDVLIVGGGDVINSYFMEKINHLAKDFTGPRYAMSVGVPYASEAKRLAWFDHSVVRSQSDYDLAISAGIPAENVSVSTDFTWLLPSGLPLSYPVQQRYRIGVCLAQPVFVRAPVQVTAGLVRLLNRLSVDYDVHMLPFNTWQSSPVECDSRLNDTLRSLCSHEAQPNIFCHDAAGVQEHDAMTSLMASMDVLMCMRYHSIQFSLKAKRPFVAVYTTQKVDNLLTEIGLSDRYGYRMPVDSTDVPTSVDVDLVYDMINNARISPPDTSAWLLAHATVDTQIPLGFINSRKRRWVRFAQERNDDIETTLVRCNEYLTRLTGLDASVVREWMLGTVPTQTLCTAVRRRLFMDSDIAATTLARTICFAITGHISTLYVWGMAQALLDASTPFNATDAIDWVRKDHESEVEGLMSLPAQPPLEGVSLRTPIDMNFFYQDDFLAFHRSGWSYCLSGLFRIDGGVVACRPRLRVDTYIDRTFHWGRHAMRAAGLLPYSTPWLGFIHHTFEESQGENNCVRLFRSDLFIKSLDACACLVVLSDYLRVQIEEALAGIGRSDVPVRMVRHPMLTVSKMFTMDKFLSNPNRKIVHIGAWLRNPYSIFALPLFAANNPLKIQKCILRGKDMAGSCEPEWLLPHLDTLPFVRNVDDIGAICRPDNNPCDDGMCRPGGDGMCRAVDEGGGICRPLQFAVRNTHVAGLVNMIHRQHGSVQVLSSLSNDEYDDMLADNLVFLDIVDCSAVNTVLECVVRNTVLIINRHPAIEEVLGGAYPGFYDNYLHAAEILSDVAVIAAIHEYMTSLDKSAYTLASFMKSFQDIVSEVTAQ